MLVVGLTGGIGSGKSTFSALLVERGAHIIDADMLGHEALLVGQPAWQSVVETFGEEILVRETLEVDRARLAEIVFADRGALTALNAIVHPVILDGIATELESLHSTSSIVVIDAALLVETGLEGACDVIIVVDADDEVRFERLLNVRGMGPEQIRARVAAQAGRSDLAARADLLVDNNGSLDRLEAETDRVWAELTRLNESKGAG